MKNRFGIEECYYSPS